MPTPANHTILLDSNGKPIPQYFVPGVGFKPLKGAGDNGPEYIIKSSALPTGAATEDKQDALIAKDFATQTTLAAILAKIIEAPATEAKQTALAALIGEVQASPTANTLLARLKSLEDKIDAITTGTTPAVTQLTGSILAQDSEGNSVPLMVEKDDQGNAVLRIIDSAPWAYDPILEANKVISLGDRKLVVVSVKKENVLANKDDSSYPDYNNSDIIPIKPPAGKIWEMKHFSFNVSKPNDATLGSHQIFIRYGSDASIATVLSAKATYLGGLIIESGIITSANSAQVPNDTLSQKLAVQSLYATYDHPIYIKYQNQTDVQQSNARNYYYAVIERAELA
jgi:hypothetical protein